MTHPNQPIEIDEHGVARFKANSIIETMVDDGTIDLNKVARGHYSDEDRAQLAQLIGYSVSGWLDLSYTPNEVLQEPETGWLLRRRTDAPVVHTDPYSRGT